LLASQGLVEFVANKGAFVREVSRAGLLEIYDLRAVLTGHACELAARERDEGGVSALRGLHAEMSDAAKSDPALYYTLNLRFHDQLVRMASSPRLQAMIDGLVKEMHLFRQVSLSRHPDMAQSNREHNEIIEAIAMGDEASARRLGEAHVRAGKMRFETAARSTAS